jgi:DNA-binding NarL/FixJ family response regulator
LATVLVIDDHPLYRRALAELARSLDDASSVSESHSVEAALQLLGGAGAPDLVLLDFRLPGKSGAEAVSLLRERCPATPIVVVSASEDRREMAAALRAGAAICLSKATPMEEMTRTLRAVLAGGVPPADAIRAVPVVATREAQALTPRQLQILALLCEGHSNKEISLRLGVGLVTVKTHVAAVFRVLGVVSRTQAVLAARRLGLG